MRSLTLVALLLLGPAVSGCLVESRLRRDGGGMLRLQYHLDENATLGAVAARLESPSVVVRSARVDRERIGTFKVTFEDASKLSTTQMFNKVSFARAPGTQAGTTDWRATIVQPKPIQLPERMLQHFGHNLKVTITFPGALVATNATSHEGATATWVIPLQTVTTAPETVFTATYTTSDAPSGGG